MEAVLQLHTNIKTEQTKHRIYNREVDVAMGHKEGTFAVKLTRLKSGNRTIITVSDIGILIKLFKCTANVLFKDVDFTKKR